MTYEEMDEEKPLACRHCGCTMDNPCDLPTGFCQWVDRDVCSNPTCVRAERDLVAAAAKARSQLSVVGGQLVDAQGKQLTEACLHTQISGSFNVARLADTGVSVVELTVFCADCKTPFKFLGDWPAGVDTLGFAANVDCTELRLSACPVDSFPDTGVKLAPREPVLCAADCQDEHIHFHEAIDEEPAGERPHLQVVT